MAVDSSRLTDRKRGARSIQLRYKVAKTVTLVLFWVTIGLLNSLAGTTLMDFLEKLNTDFEALGTVMFSRVVGTMVGCIVACLLRDKCGIQPELIVGLTAVMFSVVSFLKPWSPSVIFFGVLNTAEGFGQSCGNTISNALLLSLWGKKASMPVHTFHFGFGLGAFLGPLLVKNYLSVRCPSKETINNSTLELNALNNHTVDADVMFKCENSTKENPVILKDSRLEIPFFIEGCLLVAISAVLLIFYFLERFSMDFRLTFTESPKPIPKSETSTKQSVRAFLKSFFFKFIVGLFLLYMCINTFEGVVYNYLFTLAVEGGSEFTKPEAAYLMSAYWASYTLSRLFASTVAHFVSVKIMIFVEMVGSLCSLLSMLFLGFHGKMGMWVSACLLGVFVAPVWPSGLVFADRYVQVKAWVVASSDVGAGISGSVCMWLAGYFVQNRQGRSYLYIASSGCAIAILLLSVMQTFGRRHGDRHTKPAASRARAPEMNA